MYDCHEVVVDFENDVKSKQKGIVCRHKALNLLRPDN